MEKFNLTDEELFEAVKKGMNEADNIAQLTDRITLEILSLVSKKNISSYQPTMPNEPEEDIELEGHDLSGVEFNLPSEGVSFDGVSFDGVDVSSIKFTEDGYVDFDESLLPFGGVMTKEETDEYISDTLVEYKEKIELANAMVRNNATNKIARAFDAAKRGLLQERYIEWMKDDFSDYRTAMNFASILRQINSLAREMCYVHYRYADVSIIQSQRLFSYNKYKTLYDEVYEKMCDAGNNKRNTENVDYNEVWNELLAVRYSNGLELTTTSGYDEIGTTSFDKGYKVVCELMNNSMMNDYDIAKAAFNYVRSELLHLKDIDADDYRNYKLNQMKITAGEMMEFDDRFKAKREAKMQNDGSITR